MNESKNMAEPKISDKTQILVSVIIPTYNYSRFLADAIESALSQTYSPIEVVVVDDGSTDDTATLVETRFSERVRYLFQSNQGLSAARNTGIREAGGDFVVFLDADDRLAPSMVEDSLGALATLGESFAIVANLARLIDEKGETLADRRAFPEEDVEIHQIDLLVMSRFGANLLARRDAVISAGGFDVSLKACEDRDLWIRVAAHHRIIRLGKRLSQIRRHGANMSSNGVRQASAIRQVLVKSEKARYLEGKQRVLWAKIWSMFCYQRGFLLLPRTRSRAVLSILLSCLLWPWFGGTNGIGQAPFFRIRAIGWIVSGRWKRG